MQVIPCYKMEVDIIFCDRISNLPLDIMERILMCLPIRDAVKTTILSSKWKDKWKGIPEVIFDDYCVPSSLISSDTEVCRNKFVNFVNQFLLHHQGQIQIFRLSSSYLEECDEMEEWMQFLSWRDIKEFSFVREDYGNWVPVPSSVFSYQYLTHLELFGCELYPPDTFRCFSHLKTLIFETTYYDDRVLQSLLDKCPVLENFLLTYNGYSDLNIRAPNLKYLYVEGFFEDLCLEYTPHLSTLIVNLHVDEETVDHLEETTTCNMIQVIGGTPLLENFAAQSHFVKYLSKNMPNSFPGKYDHLKALELYAVDFEDVNQISVAICLIANSPNLEDFICSAFTFNVSRSDPDFEYWRIPHSMKCSFKRLQFVTMEDISGLPNEVEFIRFLLINSPILKTLSIRPGKRVVDQGWHLLTIMLRIMGCVNITSSRFIGAEGDCVYPTIEIIFREESSTACIGNEESLMSSENPPDEENP